MTRPYQRVAALERGLAVLTALGVDGANVAALAARTGINRATVYRILHTLEVAGYLTRSATDHRYRLTPCVRTLSDGYTAPLDVIRTATPHLGDLFRAVGWPGNLATFNGQGMEVRESTHRFSPLMAHRNMIGVTLPMTSAMGRAFLGFSTPAVRTSLLTAHESDVGDPDTVAAAVRKCGYAFVSSSEERGIGAIASAIMADGNVMACINIVAPDHVIETPALRDPLAVSLKAAVEAIERDIENPDAR